MARLELPFSIDRASRIKLPYQVADGLRFAIQCGVWKPGERLPSSREMKKALGVSVRAPAEALQILAKEGLVTLREKCGAVVCGTRRPAVRGRVLMIVPGGAQSRATALLIEHVQTNLNDAGYMTVATPVHRDAGRSPKDGSDNPHSLRQLDFELKSPWSLAVTVGYPPHTREIVARFEAAGVPFFAVHADKADMPGCVGAIPADSSEALEAVAGQCRRTGVRTAVLVRKKKTDGLSALRVLRDAGVKVKTMNVPQMSRRGRAEDLWEGAMKLFERKFERIGRKWLPDLIYFTDDHCFQSAAMSLLSRGVKVPRDVRLVTATNSGLRPPFPVSIACIENDLKEQGELASKIILGWLESKKPVPEGIALRPKYVPGETFPEWGKGK